MQQGPDAFQQGHEPTGVVEILHKEFAAGTEIGHQWSR